MGWPHARHRNQHTCVMRTRKTACLILPRQTPPILIWCFPASPLPSCMLSVSRALGLSPDNPNPQGMVNRVVQGVRLYSLET